MEKKTPKKNTFRERPPSAPRAPGIRGLPEPWRMHVHMLRRSINAHITAEFVKTLVSCIDLSNPSNRQ